MRENVSYSILSHYRSELMGIAVLWVILFHAYELQFDIQIINVIKQLGFGGVDVFILLSSLGLYMSIVRRKGERFKTYMQRRLRRILPAFWVVVGLYSIWLFFHERISFSTILWNLSTLYYWFHIPNCFNWYIPALILFYILAPFCTHFFVNNKYKGMITALSFLISYGLYRLSIPLGLNYTEDFLYRIPTFCLGLLAGHYIMSNAEITGKQIFVYCISCVFAGSIAILRIKGVLYISTCYLISLCILPLCLILAQCMATFHFKWIHSPLKFLGERSLEIYLINVIVTREYPSLSSFFKTNNIFIYYLIVYTINILLAAFMHYMLKNIRFPHYLTPDSHHEKFL